MWLSERARLLCVCQQPQQPDAGLSAPVEHALSRQHPLMRARGAEGGFFFHYSVSVRLNRREAKKIKTKLTSLTIKLATKAARQSAMDGGEGAGGKSMCWLNPRPPHPHPHPPPPPHLSVALTWRRPVIQR